MKESGTVTPYNVYSDHLGSILMITNSHGTITAEQNFDAWGRKRNPTNWQYASVPVTPTWMYRGYTGHEHLPQFALINMNGRIYDPIQGRMLSPDNYVPAPWNTQGYNRYSYANNNPLSYVDPDGNIFIPALVGALISGAATSAAIYSISTAINGNKWTWGGFGRASAMGALSAVFAEGTSILGKSLGAFGQSAGYSIMTSMVNTAAVNIAFGNNVTFGSMAGAALGGIIDGSIPQFKGFKFQGKFNFGKGLLNGVAEMGINSIRGGLVGGISGSLGALIEGEDPGEGFTNGFRTGSMAGAIRTGLNITVLGPTIRPTGKAESALMQLENDLDISLYSGAGSPVYRTGGIWQRGLTTGRSLLVGTDMESNRGLNTWIHESFHYYQQLRQTWAGQAGRGMYEQWIMKPFLEMNPYYTPGTNEAKALWFSERYYPIYPY